LFVRTGGWLPVVMELKEDSQMTDSRKTTRNIRVDAKRTGEQLGETAEALASNVTALGREATDAAKAQAATVKDAAASNTSTTWPSDWTCWAGPG
jgi:hypothetical protein